MRLSSSDSNKHMEMIHRENLMLKDELQLEKANHNKEKDDKYAMVNDKERTLEVMNREITALKESHLDAERT